MALEDVVTPGTAGLGGRSSSRAGQALAGLRLPGGAADGGGGLGLLEPPPAVPDGVPPELAFGDGTPPGDGGDDGDSGGGGGGGDGDGDAPGSGDGRDGRRAEAGSSGAIGLALVLVAVTTLFVVFLTAFVLQRRDAPEWPPAGTPTPPLGLWISTGVLLLSSFTMTRAVAAARRGERRSAIRGLTSTLALGSLFLVVQGVLWSELVSAGFFPSSNGYGAVFYALTGLHAAHVIGGLVYLALVATRLRLGGGGESPARSVPLAAVYWHYMGGVWIVLFGALYA